LDHIYPVSKGGLSTAGNMVFVCVDCNAKKRDLTLRRFLISYGFDEHYVREALDLLGKDH
ncbi:MAG: HNH endonuclease, partial [bacterium]